MSNVPAFFCLFFVSDPLIGVACEPVYPYWVPTLHTEGLQQSEVSSVQPASLRLRWVYVSSVSVCLRTPKLSLGHPGSFKSAHVLKLIKRGNLTVTSVVLFSNIQRCPLCNG